MISFNFVVVFIHVENLKTSSWCFSCCTSSFVWHSGPTAPRAGQLLSVCPVGTGWEVSALPSSSQSCAHPSPGTAGRALDLQRAFHSVLSLLSALQPEPLLCSFNLEVFLTNGVSAFLLNLFLLQSAGAFCHSNELSLSLFFLSIPGAFFYLSWEIQRHLL